MTKEEYISKFKAYYSQHSNVNFRDILKNINIEEIDKILDSATGYNILDANTRDDGKIHLQYNMQIEAPEHIEKLLGLIFDNITPPIEYNVFLKESTVKVEEEWGRFDELQYEERDNTTLWRSIELVVDFILEDKERADELYSLLQKYCYANKDNAIQNSWVVPDIRIYGKERIGNTVPIGVKRTVVGKKEIIVLVDSEQSSEKIYVNPELKEFILESEKEKKHMRKLFIVPNNDAEAIRIQELIKENNTGEYEMIITGQDWRCFL